MVSGCHFSQLDRPQQYGSCTSRTAGQSPSTVPAGPVSLGAVATCCRRGSRGRQPAPQCAGRKAGRHGGVTAPPTSQPDRHGGRRSESQTCVNCRELGTTEARARSVGAPRGRGCSPDAPVPGRAAGTVRGWRGWTRSAGGGRQRPELGPSVGPPGVGQRRHHSAGRSVAGRRGGRRGVCPAGCPAACPAGWQAGWQAGRQAGCPAGWQAGCPRGVLWGGRQGVRGVSGGVAGGRRRAPWAPVAREPGTSGGTRERPPSARVESEAR